MTSNVYEILLLASPPCEVCGQPSTRIIYDRSRDGAVEETHPRCTEHDRPAFPISEKGASYE